MNYGNIKYYDIANGPGVRTSLFVSGCRNRCKDCFQPETWNFHYGKPFTETNMNNILQSLEPEYITGFTILGGEPFEPENQETVQNILKAVRKKYPKISIWMYTGFTLQFIDDRWTLKAFRKDEADPEAENRAETEYLQDILNMIDVLVDGPFLPEKKNIMLSFRGSENQRLIDIQHSFQEKQICLWKNNI